jgi:Ca2+-binding RTX toxin-like protein
MELGSGNDTASGGSGADNITGGEGDDVIDGDGGKDKLYGNEGNDVMAGGAGNDTMTGGVGSDRFVFTTGHDVITDFEEGDDDIDLSFLDLSFAQVQAAAVEIGDDLELTFGSRSLLIENYILSMLNEEDFIL